MPARPTGPTSGKFVTTQSLWLNVELRVPELPREGHNLQARSAESAPGGGYVGAAAARAQGVESWCASPLGTGPNSHSIRRRMAQSGIETLEGAIVGDVGVGVSLVEEDGKIATVIASGVEAETSAELLQSVPINGGDIVVVHGGDLAVEPSASALASWVPTVPDDVMVVVAASPAVDQVSAATWIPVLQRADILTMNIREDAAIRDTLRSEIPGTGVRNVLKPHAARVRRTGPMGCEIETELGASPIQIRAYPSAAVDTTGVGDTHVAVMCASLLQGMDLEEACKRANAAGALTVSRFGSLPPPSREQVDSVVATGVLPDVT